ncbi:hypothetical protein AC579_9235, partial [Pseudocercospora musae]
MAVARAAPAAEVDEAVVVAWMSLWVAEDLEPDEDSLAVPVVLEPGKLTHSGGGTGHGGHAAGDVGGWESAWAGSDGGGGKVEGGAWSTEAHIAGGSSDGVVALENE